MLSYVPQRAKLLWNGTGSWISHFVSQFGFELWSLFVRGGEAAWRRQKTLRLLSPKGELENLLSYPQTRAALDSVLPTECAEDEVHDEEGAEEDEGAKVDPRPRWPAGVLHLTTRQKAQGRKKLKQTKKGTKKEKKKKWARGSKKARKSRWWGGWGEVELTQYRISVQPSNVTHWNVFQSSISRFDLLQEVFCKPGKLSTCCGESCQSLWSHSLAPAMTSGVKMSLKQCWTRIL